VERLLSQVHGVNHTSVDLKMGRVVVDISPGAGDIDEQLRKAVDDSGFTLRKIELP